MVRQAREVIEARGEGEDGGGRGSVND